MAINCDDICACLENGMFSSQQGFQFLVMKAFCRLFTDVEVTGVAVHPASGTAVFNTLGAIANASIPIGYDPTVHVDLPDHTKVVILDNQTNGDVMVSMDGGAHDFIHLKGGDKLMLTLSTYGLETTADVQIKQGTSPGNTGTFYVASIV